MIRKVEEREIRNERTIMMFDITDFTDTITVKIFVRNEQLPEMREFIKRKILSKSKVLRRLTATTRKFPLQTCPVSASLTTTVKCATTLP